MLDSLDHVDWKSLNGCYRTADEVPEFIRALLSPIRDVRAWAHEELLSAVWHQGTIYEVSAVVVPFLYEMLEADGVPDKSSIVTVIAMIATGNSYFECHTRTQESAARWEEILKKQGKTLAAEMAKELSYVAACRNAVYQKFDLIYSYLRDNDPSTRLAVSMALESFPNIADRSLPDLEVALRDETETFIRAQLEVVVNACRQRKSIQRQK
jgi:hypothetical protein